MEGLPLKYIVIVLVAALVIGAVITVVTSFTQSAQSSGAKLNQTLGAGIEKSTQEACASFGCLWNATNQSCNC